MELEIGKNKVAIKNIDKIYNQKTGQKKGEVIDYYLKIAPIILKQLKNRPFTMIHFPEGKRENSFYQKQCPVNAPDYLQTIELFSKTKGSINWCLINNTESLVYMVNRSVLEMHTWLSSAPNVEHPDFMLLDLDPSGNSGITEAVEVARAFKILLDEFNLRSFIKTSGSRGLHIFVPLRKGYTFDEVQKFASHLSGFVEKALPNIATSERMIQKRGNKIYLDALQNHMGKTVACAYSMRVRDVYSVSTPLEWDEVNKSLDPKKFTIKSIFNRLKEKGDLWEDILNYRQSLPKIKEIDHGGI